MAENNQNNEETNYTQDASDFGRGAVEGITFGQGSKIAAGVSSYVKGTDYDEELKQQEQQNEEAAKRSPVLFNTGAVVGAVAVPIPGAGLAMAGARAGMKGAAIVGTKMASKIIPKASTVTKLAEGTSGAIKSGFSALKSGGNKIVSGIKSAGESVSKTKDTFTAGFKSGTEKLGQIAEKAENIFKPSITKAKEVSGKIAESIKPSIEKIKESATKGKEIFKSTATKAIEKTKETGKKVTDFFKSKFKKNEVPKEPKVPKVPKKERMFAGKAGKSIRNLGVIGGIGGIAAAAFNDDDEEKSTGVAGGGGQSSNVDDGRGTLIGATGGVPVSELTPSGGDSGMVGGGGDSEGGIGGKTVLEVLNKIYALLSRTHNLTERMSGDISIIAKYSAQKDISADLSAANMSSRTPQRSFEQGYTGGSGGVGERAKKPQSFFQKVLKGGAAVAGIALGAASPEILKGLGSEVGTVSEKYESGGRGAGTVSSGKGDAGGASYGTHQLSSAKGTLQKFLKSSEYGKQFEGLTPGSSDFNAKWKQVAKDDPNFGKSQHEFIDKTHAAPQMQRLQKAGIDLSGKGRAVKEAVFSTSVQFGGGTDVIKNALKGKDASKLSDKEIVSAIQDYKTEHNESLFKKSSAGTRASTLKRATAEKQDLLKIADLPAAETPLKETKELQDRYTKTNPDNKSPEEFSKKFENGTATPVSKAEQKLAGMPESGHIYKESELNQRKEIAPKEKYPLAKSMGERMEADQKSGMSYSGIDPSTGKQRWKNIKTGQFEINDKKPEEWQIQTIAKENDTGEPEPKAERGDPNDPLGASMNALEDAQERVDKGLPEQKAQRADPNDPLGTQLDALADAQERSAKGLPEPKAQRADPNDPLAASMNALEDAQERVDKGLPQATAQRGDPNDPLAASMNALEDAQKGLDNQITPKNSASLVETPKSSPDLLSSAMEALSPITEAANPIEAGFEGISTMVAQLGSAIGGGNKQAAAPQKAPNVPPKDSAGRASSMMNVRNDDPILLTLQYGNVRTT